MTFIFILEQKLRNASTTARYPFQTDTMPASHRAALLLTIHLRLPDGLRYNESN